MPFLQKKSLKFNLCLGNTNYYTAIFYIYMSILLNTFWVKLEIIVKVSVSYKCTNGNIHISSEHYDRLQEMVFKGSFGHILKGIIFLKWKLANQRNKIYHKTYVLLGMQQNLSF